MTRPIPATRRVRNPAPMPPYEALAILIAYAVAGTALKREAVRTRRRKRKVKPC